MRLLYSRNSTCVNCFDSSLFEITEFKPSLKNIYLKGESVDVKTALVRMWFQLMTFGKAKIVCALDKEGNVMHTSYVVPKCFKFSFLSSKDYIIGPCYTNPKYRGQGIYPKVLEYITSTVGIKETVFYMCVDVNNASSIKGIEKAGFKRIGTAEKTRIFKRYYLG